jgi:hypothetical protein
MSQVAAARRYYETRGHLAYATLALIPIVQIAWLAGLGVLAFKFVTHFL